MAGDLPNGGDRRIVASVMPASQCRELNVRAALVGAGTVLSLLFATALAGAQTSADPNLTRQVQAATPINLPSLAPLVQRVSPAVVNISSELSGEAAAKAEQSPARGDQPSTPFDELLRRFFEKRDEPKTHEPAITRGSGFIIDPSGYIVTNNHVTGDTEKITVISQDNSRHPAKIVGRDEKTDLALLKIDAKEPLPFVTWGDSGRAKVGDWVVAVGNPFGLGGTVTAGIISALGRDINAGPYDDFIQVDAPINRGNSGGPTFNLSGEVIGINTAIYSPTGGSVGIGFAIPSDTAKNIVAQLRAKGRVSRGWLGVDIQAITPAIASSLGLNPQQPTGALVASVTPKGPAAVAGVEQGDVIVEAAGHPIKEMHDLPKLIVAAPIGEKFTLTIRRNGQEINLDTTVAELQENAAPTGAAGSGEAEVSDLGLQLSPIGPARHRGFRIPEQVKGVVVTKLTHDGPAAAQGIELGDVIVSIDQHPATTPKDAAAELQQAGAKDSILLLISRHGQSQFVGLSIKGGGASAAPN